MILIPVRHGETEWNVRKIEMGQLDSPLTSRGVRQAEALAERLNGIPFTQLYSSDLGRAVQTSDIISARCRNITVRLDPNLRERNMGVFQGLTIDEIRAKYPKERAECERTGFYDVIPGGETAQQRSDRSLKAFTAIAELHPAETVVVVTHGGVLTGFLEAILKIPFGFGPRFKKQNAAFNAFEYIDAKWSLQTWNDFSHLAGLTAIDDPMAKEG